MVWFAVSGCGGDVSFETGVESLEQAACHNPDGLYSMLASFGISAANELHRWEHSDFVVTNGKLALSMSGNARCATTGNCPTLKALLNMQGAKLLVVNGQRVFDPVQYCEHLKVYNERARITWGRYVGLPWYSEKHYLTFTSRAPGLCSYDYTFGTVESGGDGGNLEYSSKLLDKLIIAGYPENPWLLPRITLNTVTIDPGELGLLGMMPLTAGNCVDSCWLFDQDASEVGRCCSCRGVAGTLRRSAWDTTTLECAL